MASFLIVENASLATTYPDICTAYLMYITVLVTIATAERSFSKLKLIKSKCSAEDIFKASCPKTWLCY